MVQKSDSENSELKAISILPDVSKRQLKDYPNLRNIYGEFLASKVSKMRELKEQCDELEREQRNYKIRENRKNSDILNTKDNEFQEYYNKLPIGIRKSGFLFKKYLKYKNKYLQLKNKLNI